jgi:hypothetical protein
MRFGHFDVQEECGASRSAVGARAARSAPSKTVAVPGRADMLAGLSERERRLKEASFRRMLWALAVVLYPVLASAVLLGAGFLLAGLNGMI